MEYIKYILYGIIAIVSIYTIGFIIAQAAIDCFNFNLRKTIKHKKQNNSTKTTNE